MKSCCNIPFSFAIKVFRIYRLDINLKIHDCKPCHIYKRTIKKTYIFNIISPKYGRKSTYPTWAEAFQLETFPDVLNFKVSLTLTQTQSNIWNNIGPWSFLLKTQSGWHYKCMVSEENGFWFLFFSLFENSSFQILNINILFLQMPYISRYHSECVLKKGAYRLSESEKVYCS